VSEADVLVVGGGLGGVIAALAAARADEHASIRLVAPREHPFEAESGLVDVLGYPDGGVDPVAEPFEALSALPADHPCARFGETPIRDGLALFDRATSGTYTGGHDDANGLVPTGLGSLRPAVRYPAAVEPGLCSRREATTLVGLASLPDFDASHAAKRLRAAAVPFDVSAIELSMAIAVDESAPARSLATSLEANEAIGRGVPIRESVASGIDAQVDDPDRVGLPAVLGLDDAAPVHAAIEAELEARVFEIPLGPPSLLGRRLESTLFRALSSAGVTVDRGVDVESVSVADGRVERVELDDADGGGVSPEAVVLATGGPAAGGVTATRDRIVEARFGCHVPHPDDRRRWAEPSALGEHRLATVGVRLDDATRPLTDGGEPVAENLYAAGRLVGGHDFVAQHAVGGVALATGVIAGRAAVGASR
jgi:glycerol-3-phosphate dehydrogenase subunit B